MKSRSHQPTNFSDAPITYHLAMGLVGGPLLYNINILRIENLPYYIYSTCNMHIC